MTKFNHLSVKERRGKKRKLNPKTFYLEIFSSKRLQIQK